MNRENIITLLLGVLVVVALLQTLQLTDLKGKITSNVVKEVNAPSEYPIMNEEQLVKACGELAKNGETK